MHSPLKFFDRSAAIARVYDIIGDIHGHATLLKRLLMQLGYHRKGGAWRFPGGSRRAVFVGDYIDRGPEIRETLRIVREMVENDSGRALMGNHEFNAVGWHTVDPLGRPYRSHNQSHLRQHKRTLEEYAGDSQALHSDIAWMRRLPFFFENESIRVVHAAWDQRIVDWLRKRENGSEAASPLTEDTFLHDAFQRGKREFEAVETLLKGYETPLPEGYSYTDKDGTRRFSTRIRWWSDHLSGRNGTVSLREIATPPADRLLEDVEIPLSRIDVTPYSDTIPVFFGHYWLTGTPAPLSPGTACLDYSVAKGGPLCAYRYDGEFPLRRDKFVSVS